MKILPRFLRLSPRWTPYVLLLPFVAGQLVQRWLRPWVLAHRGLATFMDRTAIETRLDAAGLRVGIILTGGNVDLDALPWLKK